MTLDELEKRAAFLLNYSGDEMARAVLHLLPVVRAAESWRDFVDRHPYGSRGDDDLENAVDNLRLAFPTKKED